MAGVIDTPQYGAEILLISPPLAAGRGGSERSPLLLLITCTHTYRFELINWGLLYTYIQAGRSNS